MKKHIIASDLYDFKKCAYRPFMDYNGDPAEKIEIHPLVKLLWSAGVQYENKVIESFKKERPDKIFCEIDPKSPTSEALAEKTLTAMKEGVDFIYQGVLISENKIGRPDLLIKEAGKSSLGDYFYYPMDIKLAQVDDTWDDGNEKLKIEHLWQLHFYADLLEKIQETRPPTGIIYKTKLRKLPVDLFKTPKKYPEALSALQSYLKGDPNGAEPAIKSDCKMCEWKKHCIKWAEERQDTSLLFYVGDSMKTGLKQLGIKSVNDLAGQDPTSLFSEVQKLKKQGFFYPAVNEELIRRIINRAKLNGGTLPIFYEPIVFPKNDKEIHFDMEGDPTRDFVYLHGLLVVEKGKEPVYQSFFSGSYEDEALITKQLLAFFKKHEGVPIYHYANYEKAILKRLISKHKLEDHGVYEMLFGEKGTAIDLFEVIKKSSDWPLTSYSVKAICKLLGFQWAAKDASGAASIVWMNDFLAGDKTMKDKILQYNEDDCRATLFLKNKLIEMQSA